MLWAEKTQCSIMDARNAFRVKPDGENIFLNSTHVTVKDDANDLVEDKNTNRSFDVSDFRAMDADGDGYVTADELKMVLTQSSGMSETDAAISAEKMIRSADKNGDNRLDFGELKEVMSVYLHGKGAERRDKEQRISIVPSPAIERRSLEDAPLTLDEHVDETKGRSEPLDEVHHHRPGRSLSPRRERVTSFVPSHSTSPYAKLYQSPSPRLRSCGASDVLSGEDMLRKEEHIKSGRASLTVATDAFQYEMARILDFTHRFFGNVSQSRSRGEISDACRQIRELYTFWSRPYAFGPLNKSCKASLIRWVHEWLDDFDAKYGRRFAMLGPTDEIIYEASLSAIAADEFASR